MKYLLGIPVNVTEAGAVNWLHGIAALQHSAFHLLHKKKTTFRRVVKSKNDLETQVFPYLDSLFCVLNIGDRGL